MRILYINFDTPETWTRVVGCLGLHVYFIHTAQQSHTTIDSQLTELAQTALSPTASICTTKYAMDAESVQDLQLRIWSPWCQSFYDSWKWGDCSWDFVILCMSNTIPGIRRIFPRWGWPCVRWYVSVLKVHILLNARAHWELGIVLVWDQVSSDSAQSHSCHGTRWLHGTYLLVLAENRWKLKRIMSR